MKYEVVNRMSEELTISEFNELANNAKIIYSVSNRRIFFEARVLEKLDILLVEETVFLCRDNNDNENNIKTSTSELFEIIEMKLHRKIDKILKRKIIENMCEVTNYYIFLLK